MNEVVNEVRQQYEEALASGGVAADALKGATKVIASRMFQRGSVVLEFLQNAEDAKATEFTVELSSSQVVFRNNGDPFVDKDVRSLCSIGNSAKLVSGGYLGYFGIGFKSAFRISSKVQVFSGDFAFGFDQQCWQDKDTDFPWQIVPHAIDAVPGGVGARFVCTLDSGEKGKRSIQSLLERAEHLGRAFMFLKNVTVLKWNDDVNGKPRTFTKTVEKEFDVLKDGTITKQQELTLHLGTDKEQWLLFRRTVGVPPEIKSAPETIEAGREELAEREVVVGFQLDEDRKLRKAAGASIYGGIFSHLPLTAEQANLPFIIQGDFVSEGGRDALDEAHPWNHWMLTTAATLLADVAEVFKADHAWKYQFLDLMLGQVPATTSVKQYFFEELKTRLRERDVVLTDSGEWIKPVSSLVQETQLDPFCAALGSSSWQEVSSSDKWFVSPRLDNRTVIRDQLGGSRLTRGDVMAVIASEKWDLFLQGKAKSADAPSWFRNMYMSLEGMLHYQASEYKGKPWVLTADLTVDVGKNTMLPSDHIADVPDDMLSLVFKMSPNAIVHPEILQGTDDKTTETVKAFLKAMEVGDTTVEWFVEQKLFPLLETPEWAGLPAVEQLGAIQVIIRWFSLNPSRAKAKLRDWNSSEKLRLPTKEEGLWAPAGKLYLPAECGGRLESLLAPLGGNPESFVNTTWFLGVFDKDVCAEFLAAAGAASIVRVIPAESIVEARHLLGSAAGLDISGKNVRYQTVEFIEPLLAAWSKVDGDQLFTYLIFLWAKAGPQGAVLKNPTALITEANGSETQMVGWSPLWAAAQIATWIPTDEGLRSPRSLHQKPAFYSILTDKPLVHGLAPLLSQADYGEVNADFLDFCGVRDTRQGLSENDLVSLVRLLSGTGWPRERSEQRLSSIFKRLSSLNGGTTEHKDVPILTCAGNWVPLGQVFMNDQADSELFEDLLPFAWIPDDNPGQYSAVLRSLGAHSTQEELTSRITPRSYMGTYPFVSVLMEIAGIKNAQVERFGYLSLTLSLGGYDKDVPKSFFVDNTGGHVRVLLHKDFGAADSEIAQLEGSLAKIVPSADLHGVQFTKVVERVAVEEVFRREEVQKKQQLEKAAIGSGFDFHSSGPQGSYKVEAKGREEKGEVTLIGEEPKAALQWGNDYLLYIVYNCRTPEPQTKHTSNPAKAWEERKSTIYALPEKTWSAW